MAENNDSICTQILLEYQGKIIIKQGNGCPKGNCRVWISDGSQLIAVI